MTTQQFTQFIDQKNEVLGFWATIAAFINHVAAINARNGATGPFGL